MIDFNIIYYIIILMFSLVFSVFLWGLITYKKIKTNVKFLNVPLLTLTLGVASVGMILTLVPLTMRIWEYDSDFIRSDPVLISILVFEFIFLAGFLILAFIYAYDFGIALDKKNNRLQFFGQTINTEKITALEEKKYSLKVVYEQGYKNITKKLALFSPKAKMFVKENLADIIAKNQETKQAAILQEQLLKDQTVNIDKNISEVNTDTVSVMTKQKNESVDSINITTESKD